MKQTLVYLAGLAGLLMAIYTALFSGDRLSNMPDDAIVVINDRTISRTDYNARLTALEVDKRNPLTAEDRLRIFQNMIDEELLLQRALELRLPENSPLLRKRVIEEAMAFAVASAKIEASDDILKDHFETHQNRFVTPETYKIMGFRIGEHEADTIAAKLREGEAFEKVMSNNGAQAINLPSSFLPAVKILDYVGEAPLRVLKTMEAGEIAGPINLPGDKETYLYLWLVEKRGGKAPAFSDIQSQIRNDWQRRQEEKALTDYLDRLERRASIEKANDAPL